MENERKVALVTGSSSGIGLEVSLLLLKKGFSVYGASRRVNLLSQIEREGGFALPLDLTNESSIKNCVTSILKKEGKIDLLINNAGFGLGGSIEETSIEDARKQFEVNVFGLVGLTRLVLPSMRERRCGRIVNISSMAGRFSTPFLGWYHATKYSLEALSTSLRLEVKGFGIDVVIVEPGFIKTNWGLIASQTLRNSSFIEDYKKAGSSVASFYEKTYEKNSNRATPPSKVARVIVRSSVTLHPKTRYKVGKASHLFIALAKFLPDSIYDMMLRFFFKIKPCRFSK